MISNVIAIERTKLFKRRMLWIELALLALGIIAMNVMLYFVATAQRNSGQIDPNITNGMIQSITWPGGILGGLSFAAGNTIGGLLIIIIVGALTAQEYNTRTAQLWLSQGTSRATLFGGKFLSFLLPIALVPLVALVIGALVTAVLSLQLLGHIDASQINLLNVVLAWIGTAYTILPYAALTFLVAVVTRSSAAAIGIGLGYTVMAENLLTQLVPILFREWGQIVLWLPGNLAMSILKLNSVGGNLFEASNASAKGVDPLQAGLGIAAYTLVLVGLAIVAFKRQDLTN